MVAHLNYTDTYMSKLANLLRNVRQQIRYRNAFPTKDFNCQQRQNGGNKSLKKPKSSRAADRNMK